MSVAAIPTSYSASLPVFGTDDPGHTSLSRDAETNDPSDVRLRSERYALALLSDFRLPHDVATAFLNPIALETTDNALLPVSETISELLNPRSIQESLTPIRFEHHQRLVKGLARCLAWIYARSPWDQNSIVEQSALQALIPLYWIPVNESWEQQLSQSLHHLRRHASFLLWRDSLEQVDIHSWLRRLHGTDSPLTERIESSFRLCLSHLSHIFWTEMAAQSQRSRLPGLNHVARDFELETWALATSLLRENTDIQIPSSLSSASMAIDDIRDHWNRLSRWLSIWNTGETAVARNEPHTSSPYEELLVQRFVSISDRHSSPFIANLKQALESDEDESLLTLAVVRPVTSTSIRPPNTSPGWIAELCSDDETTIKGTFKTDEQDWVIVYSGVDRSELARKMREIFEKLGSLRPRNDRSQPEQAFVAGIATVIDPTSSFQVSGLVEGAWRCLEAAQLQGPNAVKTIQVY